MPKSQIELVDNPLGNDFETELAYTTLYRDKKRILIFVKITKEGITKTFYFNVPKKNSGIFFVEHNERMKVFQLVETDKKNRCKRSYVGLEDFGIPQDTDDDDLQLIYILTTEQGVQEALRLLDEIS